MTRRMLTGLAAGALVAAMVPGVASAAPSTTPFQYADIDSNGDCDVYIGAGPTEINREEPGDVNVAINKNWFIGTCHIDLDTTEVADLGGPFPRAQVYRGFTCYVGNETDETDDGDQADVIELTTTISHAVVTPSSRMNIVCKAKVPRE